LAQFPAVQSPVTQTCRGPSDLMWKKLALKGEKQLGFWSQLPPGVCPRSGFVELDVFQRKRFPQIKDFFRKVLLRRKSSVKQVLTPPFVAVADHAHELPRGM
jgi:hypothetical protein